jgi:DNA-binding transcriptional ArsR family regulator
MPPAENLEIRDPRAMRALAHPARLAMLELLYAKGTANATEAARELGGSPQAAAYHLRALAKWGLVGRAESSDGRETRWELTARSISFETVDDSPQFRSAARALERRVLERDQRAMEEWLAAEQDEPPEWRKAATTNSGTAYLTPEELEEFADEVRKLWRKYERLDVAERPEGSRRIHVAFRAIPRVDPKPTRRKS